MAKAKKKQVKMRKNGKSAKTRARTIDFLKNVLYIYGRILLTKPERTRIMKRQLFVLACAAVAAIGTACSSDPALKTMSSMMTSSKILLASRPADASANGWITVKMFRLNR